MAEEQRITTTTKERVEVTEAATPVPVATAEAMVEATEVATVAQSTAAEATVASVSAVSGTAVPAASSTATPFPTVRVIGGDTFRSGLRLSSVFVSCLKKKAE